MLYDRSLALFQATDFLREYVAMLLKLGVQDQLGFVLIIHDLIGLNLGNANAYVRKLLSLAHASTSV